jgi:hypothetical protein
MTNAKPMERVAYGDYLIEALPRQPNGAGPWLAELRVARATARGTDVQLFNAPGAFPTRAAAVAAGVRHGRDVIDGNVTSHEVLF